MPVQHPRSRFKNTLLPSLMLVVSSTTAAADVIPITNHSFEDISTESPFNEFTFGPLNGWDLYDPNDITNEVPATRFLLEH